MGTGRLPIFVGRTGKTSGKQARGLAEKRKMDTKNEEDQYRFISGTSILFYRGLCSRKPACKTAGGYHTA